MMDFLDKKDNKIIKCYRNFVSEVSDHIPDDIYDQEADGDTVLKFSDDTLLLFLGVTETSGLEIHDGLDSYYDSLEEFSDVSANDFWENRLNAKILKVERLFHGDNVISHGVRFYLENGLDFKIEYHWETEYDDDTTVIRTCS